MLVARRRGLDIKFGRYWNRGITKKLAVPVAPCVLCVYIHPLFLYVYI